MLTPATARALVEAGYMPLSVYLEMLSGDTPLPAGCDAEDGFADFPASAEPVAA